MIRDLIIEHLGKTGETQASLAQRLGISDRYLADVKNGHKPPSLDFGFIIIDGLDCNHKVLKHEWINSFVSSKSDLGSEYIKEMQMTEEKKALSKETSFKFRTP